MRTPILLLLATAAVASAASAQGTTPLTVGTPAPDFVAPEATAAGVSAKPFRLSEQKGRTVVIAFFYKARTKG